MSKKKPLTPKQAAFVREYLIDLNAMQAALRAGFAESMARSKVGLWVRQSKTECPEEYHHVWDAVQEAKAKRVEKLEIDSQWVLQRAVELVQRSMQEVDPVTSMSGKQVIDKKTGRPLFKFDGKVATSALKLVGEHITIQAFKKQVEVSGGLDIAEILRRGRKARGEK